MEIHGRPYEIEIRINTGFKASHSLPMRPELHLHHWDVEFSISGPLNPQTGMVCDMLELSEFFKPFVSRLNRCNLHDFIDFQNEEMRIAARFPTCDTLAHYFLWKTVPPFEQDPKFRGLRISQIKVSIAEPDSFEAWGHALIRPKNA